MVNDIIDYLNKTSDWDPLIAMKYVKGNSIRYWNSLGKNKSNLLKKYIDAYNKVDSDNSILPKIKN